MAFCLRCGGGRRGCPDAAVMMVVVTGRMKHPALRSNINEISHREMFLWVVRAKGAGAGGESGPFSDSLFCFIRFLLPARKLSRSQLPPLPFPYHLVLHYIEPFERPLRITETQPLLGTPQCHTNRFTRPLFARSAHADCS